MSEKTVEFKDLVGSHTLSGVDFATTTIDQYGYDKEASFVNFELDGVVYTAMEDPKDGYRSSLDRIFIQNNLKPKLKNRFSPSLVDAVFAEKPDENEDSYYGACKILKFKDAITGLVVLEIGTENTDDYYPCFVASFHPENMAVNIPVGKTSIGDLLAEPKVIVRPKAFGSW